MKANKNYFFISTIIVSIFIITGIYLFFSNKIENESPNKVLDTCKTPQEAFEETQKALQLLSANINSGIKNAQPIKEYENAKNKVFKNEK